MYFDLLNPKITINMYGKNIIPKDQNIFFPKDLEILIDKIM